MKKAAVKIAKISGITLAVLLILLLTAGYLFSKEFNKQFKIYANKHIKSKLDFSETELSFFKHFPTLTFTLYDFSLLGAPPFGEDTLLASKEIALGVDLPSLFSGKMNITNVFLTDAFINVKVTEDGKANYDIYESADSTKATADSSGGADLQIENIIVENSTIAYEDRSFPMIFKAKGFDYAGSGDLSQSLFDLNSKIRIDSFDFNYDNQYYFVSKQVDADLLTSINTKSLAFRFTRNDLRINNLPVAFSGFFEFLKNGYNMDFNIRSEKTKLSDVITALPQEYMDWVSETDLKGDVDIQARLSGKYIAETETMPDLSMNIKLRNGYVSHNKAPVPVNNIHLDFHSALPGMEADSMEVALDSLSFNMGKDYFGAMARVKGLESPNINARVNTEINLDKFCRAIGLDEFDVRGHYALHADAKGIFSQGQNPESKTPDTIITSTPAFHIASSLRNGYFNNKSVPEPVTNISFSLKADCESNDYKKSNLSIENLNADFLKSYLRGYIKVKGGEPLYVDAGLQSTLELSAIDKIMSLDSMEVSGQVTCDLTAKGKFNYEKEIYPSAKGSLQLTNGRLLTKHHPQPVEDISVNASLFSPDGTLKRTRLVVKPLSFTFEKQPVEIKMDLFNFDDILYDISAKGSADLGHLSNVFPQDGLDAEGFIKANLQMRGLQSDLAKERYDKLDNSGSLSIEDIQFNSSHFPKPFHVKSGTFSFIQDSLMMDDFTFEYGSSDMHLSGSMHNVLNYYLKNETLRGRFFLKSDYLNIDEFMASSGNQQTPAATSAPSRASASTGVVVIPPEYDIIVRADIDKVELGSMDITNATAEMVIDSGILRIVESGFTMIGAPVVMNAAYASQSERRAWFDYHISAKSFDIKRAYDEVPIFRELVTSASKARGIISLDYSLKGKLNEGMQPIYPSLEGGGTLSVLKAQMKGYKLFSAIGKEAGKDSLSNPDISNVDIKTTIKNNVITLLPVKMRIAAFRPKIQGQITFDGKLNLKVRLGLPPLGVVGIPVNVTGTQEKPIVKLGRGKNNEPLTETVDEED